MELNYSELTKRDVINVSDGRCLGRIIDVRFSFPKGVLVGIVVPGKRKGLFSLFDKSELYIDRSRIIKIGGDVILVNLKTNDSCAQVLDNQDQFKRPNSQPCPPPCTTCAPCPPQKPKDCIDLSGVLDENGRLDLSDY